LFRRRFAAAAIVVAMPALFLLLRQQGAPPLTAILVSASIIPIFVSALTGQLFEVVSKLHQDIMPLQRIQLSGALMRLVTIAGAASLLPSAWIASIAAGAAQAWMTSRQRLLARSRVEPSAEPISSDKKHIVRQVRRMAPGAVYFAFSGQINVWLISAFGEADVIAQVGALGRLAMGFNIVMAVFSMLFVPRFARIGPVNGASLLRWFWRAQVGLAALLSAIVIAIAAFPSAALALLGPKYALLETEVVLAAAGGAAAQFAGSAFTLAAARGVIANPLFTLPAAILVQALLAFVLPVSTAAGVLWLGILANLVFWLIHAVNFSRNAFRAG
jgi:hypothetical protein